MRGCHRGRQRALRRRSSKFTELFLVGREEEIKAALTRTGCRDPRVQIVHASEVLTMEDKPVEGIAPEKGLLHSARRRIGQGRQGRRADFPRQHRRHRRGQHHPAAAAAGRRTGRASPRSFPRRRTNLSCWIPARASNASPMHLLHFAIMGSIYSREILGYKNPRVGILSNGTEANKGTELTQEAFRLCKMADLNFIGNVEGHDLFHNRVDVVVCDGFIGNIVLEDAGKLCQGPWSPGSRTNSPRTPSACSAPCSLKSALRTIKRRMDPDSRGGAPLLGPQRHRLQSARLRPRTGHHERHRRVPPRPSNITSTKSSQPKSPRPTQRVAPNRADHRHRMKHHPPKNSKTRAPATISRAAPAPSLGVGSYVPERVLTNADLEKMVDTSDEWITTRTGIKERRIAAKDEATSDLAAKAALRAMERAKVTPERN